MSDDIKLVPLKDCITKDLYEMYKDIPKEELGSLNPLNNVSFDEFSNYGYSDNFNNIIL